MKRSGEAVLFNEATGKPTDDTIAMCKVLGIDPRELYQK